jgi:PAS domain-containing protein
LGTYFSAPRVGLGILDSDLRFLAINHTLAEMNGIPAEAHLGKSVREMLGDWADLIEPQFERVLSEGQPILNREFTAILPSRVEPGHWIEHFIPIKDKAGRLGKLALWWSRLQSKRNSKNRSAASPRSCGRRKSDGR